MLKAGFGLYIPPHPCPGPRSAPYPNLTILPKRAKTLTLYRGSRKNHCRVVVNVYSRVPRRMLWKWSWLPLYTICAKDRTDHIRKENLVAVLDGT